MNDSDHELLLSFLDGSLASVERERLLDRLDAEPELARELRRAAAGRDALLAYGPPPEAGPRKPRRTSAPHRVSPWWAAVASAATLAIAVPTTLMLAARGEAPTNVPYEAEGAPDSPDPSYVLVLHGRWPDATAVDVAEQNRRATEYWAWTTSLAEEGILVAAGDLRWEPGRRLGPSATQVALDEESLESPDYIVGMFALRVGSYEQAEEIARACPHLRYGGSVSVRRVGGGFVTVPGMGDWTD